ncbi:MAG: prepilin-type N-terminal cleavage/methylation domain-containing protein [Gemmatimonadota bacterium]|nr:prepilin-type N-terminal cleavage/methylation domain-containing protein [Gemmatimonadota bacterium]
MRVRRAPRQGFILIEVLVAMVLLGLVLSTLAAMMFAVAKRSVTSTGASYRNAILMQEVNRLEALPYDSLAVGSSSVTVSAMPYPHTRVITVSALSSKAKQVQVVITPSVVAYKPDTVKFSRTLPATTTALDQPTGG